MRRPIITESEIKNAIERFNQINGYSPKNGTNKLNEYTYYSGLQEDGEDNTPEDAPQNGNAPMGDPNGDMGNPPMDGNDQQPSMNGNAPMGGNGQQQPENGMQQPPMDGNAPMDGNDPMGGADMGGDEPMDMPMGDDMPMDGEEDEVIDVDDLTQSQEATELRIDDVNSKIENIMSVLSKFNSAITSLDNNISSFKAEMEKRVPTKKEKIQMRSVVSAPYNTTPESYWKDKMDNSNYEISNDDPKNFDISEDDINIGNYRDIQRSFNESVNLKDFLTF